MVQGEELSDSLKIEIYSGLEGRMKKDANRYLVRRLSHPDEGSKFAEKLGITLSDEDCQTIGGLVTKTIGRLPVQNERIPLFGLNMTVVSVDERKVNRLVVEKIVESEQKTERKSTT